MALEYGNETYAPPVGREQQVYLEALNCSGSVSEALEALNDSGALQMMSAFGDKINELQAQGIKIDPALRDAAVRAQSFVTLTA